MSLRSLAQELIQEIGGSLEKGKFYVYDPAGNAQMQGRPVCVTSGQFMGEHGVSNFFGWQEVQPDGSLSQKKEQGYPPIGKGRTEKTFRPISAAEAVALAKEQAANKKTPS